MRVMSDRIRTAIDAEFARRRTVLVGNAHCPVFFPSCPAAVSSATPEVFPNDCTGECIQSEPFASTGSRLALNWFAMQDAIITSLGLELCRPTATAADKDARILAALKGNLLGLAHNFCFKLKASFM